MFEVIYGSLSDKIEKQKKRKEFLHQKYYDLYLDYQYGFENLPDKNKAIFYGVKYIGTTTINGETNYHDLLKLFTEISDINTMIKSVSIKEIMELFPIDKEFDGEKTCSRDYFSTIEYLSTINVNDIIGNNFDEFMANYWNHDIVSFLIKEFLVLDSILKVQNRTGLMDRALDFLDPDGKISTYKYYPDKGYMQCRETGKTFSVKEDKRVKNRFLKIVKPES